MRNSIHIALLLGAAVVWLTGIFLGFQQPLLGIAGTCCTFGLLFLAGESKNQSSLSKPGQKF